MKSICNKLIPIFVEDKEEWDELKPTLIKKDKIMWYGGSSFDLKPFMDIETGNSPIELQKILQPNPLYIMTDYSSKFVQSIKSVYANFDRDNFNLENYPDIYGDNKNVEIEQMIPLKLFSFEELAKIKEQYTDYHSSVTLSVIPDNEWHFCYVAVTQNSKSIDIIIGFVENLVFWKEIVEKHDISIDVFCALRVGGKSGSWDYTHSPKQGKLFNAIKNSLPQKRPKYWIADDCYELKKIWTEIEPHENGFYGDQHFFKTRYDNT
jgi:hypothetical protein